MAMAGKFKKYCNCESGREKFMLPITTSLRSPRTNRLKAFANLLEILSQWATAASVLSPYLMANRQTDADADGHCSRIGTADRPSIRVKMDPIMRAPFAFVRQEWPSQSPNWSEKGKGSAIPAVAGRWVRNVWPSFQGRFKTTWHTKAVG